MCVCVRIKLHEYTLFQFNLLAGNVGDTTCALTVLAHATSMEGATKEYQICSLSHGIFRIHPNTGFNLNVPSLHCQMCGPCSPISNRVTSSGSSSSMSVLEFIFAVREGAGTPLFAEACGLNIGTSEVQTRTSGSSGSILLVKMRTKPRP